MSAVVNLRSEPQRSQPSWYSRRYTVATRYVDLDDQDHVNNVAVLALFAEARLLWVRELLPAVSDHDFMTLCGGLRARRATTEYLMSGLYPAPVEAGLRVEGSSADGLRLSMGLFQGGACIALQSCEIGYGDRRGWAALPAMLVDALSAAELVEVSGSGDSPWLQLDRYPLRAPVQGRYGDMDSAGFIGEVQACRILEASRFDMLLAVMRETGVPTRVVIGRLAYEAHELVNVRGELTGAAAVTQLGRSSLGWQSALFRGKDCVALLDVTQIHIGEDSRPKPLPEPLREILARWMAPASA